MHQFKQGVIAHRGVSHLAPENTVASFKMANELGIEWVEFDVMLSKDQVPVVFHDDTLSRTTNGSGFIDQYTFDELRKLDAGSWFSSAFAGEKIPSLSEVIGFLAANQMNANIEIKVLHDNDVINVQKTLEVIAKIRPPADSMFLFSSFSIDALHELKRLIPAAKRGLLIDEWHDDWLELCQELECVSLNVNHGILTLERVQAVKSNGLMLLAYTVDDPARAEELREWGVDAVFSNQPELTKRPVIDCSGHRIR